MASRSGVDRVLAKCQSCVDSGNFYEAHQMYRTLYFRYKGQKKYMEALDLLYNGSLTLLQHNQHSSGADLAMLMIELLNSSMSPVTEETIVDAVRTNVFIPSMLKKPRDPIISGKQLGKSKCKVVRLFQTLSADCPERHLFLVAAVRWSMKVDSKYKQGHPDLHQKIGVLFWQEKNYTQARYHFIHSTDGHGCASMLIEFHSTSGYSSELDMFIAQAVLQYLCLKNKDTAQLAFQTYTKNHPQIEPGPPYITPLLNFIWFLLLALDTGRLTVFSILCEKYEKSISRDPMYKEYLDKIGQLFFGVPPPRAAPQGFFGNLMQSLFGGEDGEEDTMQTSTSSIPSLPTPTREVTHADLD